MPHATGICFEAMVDSGKETLNKVAAYVVAE